MTFKETPEALLADHLSPEQALAHRKMPVSRALVREAGMRAMAALKAIRLERYMQEQGAYKPLPDGVLEDLEQTLKKDVQTWLEGTACPHCGGFIGDQ